MSETTGLNKEYLRGLSNKYWVEEIGTRAREENLEFWTDLVNLSDYKQSLEGYFGDLELLRGKRFADIGVGFGSVLHELLRDLGVKTVNVDVAPASIQFLREKGEKGVVADAFNLPLVNNSIDGVVSVNLINTGAAMDLDDMGEIFREFHRVLKNGGVLIQSHWGFLDSPIPRDEQIRALEGVGFKKIRTIDNSATARVAFLEPLSFIATKAT